MFDFAWSEFALIGVVALLVIGPKDLPVAIKAVSQMVKKARRMAGEFQTHVDEMVREADLHEVRNQISDLRRMDIKSKILNAVDGDGSIRRTIHDIPNDINPAPPPVPVADAVPASVVPEFAATAVPVPGTTEFALPQQGAVVPDAPAAPAFIPPEAVAPKALPPAFIPPAAVAAAHAPSPYA